ncbi:hypothetical protein EV189_2255 [Motilibacter rhizosphaerae]|uniref:Uncharacterized protein n=2 Tax=Motilibacter rhizosphaerae TaxID=598652 RepID=A0A4Q7NNM9_9ACTN|nr:hypothetical protein EV189_2255 [Motilibacter rhizosphaerae]
MTEAAGPAPYAVSPVDERCAAMLKALRARCPHLVLDGPVAPGGTPGPIPVPPDGVQSVLVTALRQNAAGGTVTTGDALPQLLLWTSGPDRLLLDLTGVRVEVGEGQLLVHLLVICDQLTDPAGGQGGGEQVVTVRFVLGSPKRPAGLLAATPRLPEGPPVVVERWGEALTAYAWQAVLDASAGLAAATGRDTDGAPLVPTALTASADGLEVLPQARHPMDRRRAGAST